MKITRRDALKATSAVTLGTLGVGAASTQAWAAGTDQPGNSRRRPGPGYPRQQPPPTNADYPIIAAHDPTTVTHTITSRGATLGFSRHGGGYINYLDLGDGVNLVAMAFGRGGQTAVRDGLHSRRYNPTQAGYTAGGGTPVDLYVGASHSGPGERLAIPRFNMCLFNGDGRFNYNQYVDLYPKWPGYAEGDADGLAEVGLSQDDECRSEFDFLGYIEDASGLAGSVGIPVFKHYTGVEYSRDPGSPITVAGEPPQKYSAIHQAGPAAVLENGHPVLDEPSRITDLSPVLFPNEQARNTDMSVFFNRFSLRIVHSAGYHYGLWVDPSGNWESTWLEPTKPKTYHMRLYREDRYLDRLPGGVIRGGGPAGQAMASEDLAIAATSEDPETARAVGVFFPQESAYNHHSVAGIDRKTGRVLYTEDRRMRTQSILTGGGGWPGPYTVEGATFEGYFTIFQATQYLTGVFAPGIHGHADAVERVTREVYLLMGTPVEIREAADNIRRSLPRAYRPVPEVPPPPD